MPDIHLNRFRNLAAEAPDAKIELHAQGGDLQVQKTGLSARLGRFFTSHTTLLKRTENASSAFYKALSDQYGDHIAKEALGQFKGISIREGQVRVDGSYFLTAGIIQNALKIAGSLEEQKKSASQNTPGTPAASPIPAKAKAEDEVSLDFSFSEKADDEISLDFSYSGDDAVSEDSVSVNSEQSLNSSTNERLKDWVKLKSREDGRLAIEIFSKMGVLYDDKAGNPYAVNLDFEINDITVSQYDALKQALIAEGLGSSKVDSAPIIKDEDLQAQASKLKPTATRVKEFDPKAERELALQIKNNRRSFEQKDLDDGNEPINLSSAEKESRLERARAAKPNEAEMAKKWFAAQIQKTPEDEDFIKLAIEGSALGSFASGSFELNPDATFYMTDKGPAPDNNGLNQYLFLLEGLRKNGATDNKPFNVTITDRIAHLKKSEFPADKPLTLSEEEKAALKNVTQKKNEANPPS
jgi:hypothetical protein